MTDTGQQFLPLQKHFSLKQQAAGGWPDQLT
jgi:hypothetical protein